MQVNASAHRSGARWQLAVEGMDGLSVREVERIDDACGVIAEAVGRHTDRDPATIQVDLCSVTGGRSRPAWHPPAATGR